MINPIDVFLHQVQSGDVILLLAVTLLVTSVLCSFPLPSAIQFRNSALLRYRRLAWQFGAALALEQLYEFTRGQIARNADGADIALVHAYRLLDLEWRHHLFVEPRIQRFFLQFGTLMNAVDLFYIVAHVGVTIGVLVLLYLKFPREYLFARNMLMMTTGIALVAFYVYPTAPPRMLGNYGFVDPAQLHHLVPAGGDQPNSYTYNPYAAMPSLHVGYALVSAWSLWRAVRNMWFRVLCLLYPPAMAAVVIISGNHWVLDVIGACITVLLARGILLGLSSLTSAVGEWWRGALPGTFAK